MAASSSCFLEWISLETVARFRQQRFLRVVLDVGAAVSCVGYRQARALRNLAVAPNCCILLVSYEVT
jgi:hypothetical protein